MLSTQLPSFEQFCGNSPFWNSSLLLDGDDPQFTKCFQDVGLTWIPCSIFLLGVVPYISYLRRLPPSRHLAKTVTSVGKRALSLCLVIISFVTIIVKGVDSDQDDTPNALYVSECLKALCFLLSGLLHHLCVKRGVLTSIFLWLFWLLMTVCAIVPFYSNIIENVFETDLFSFVIFYIYFFCLLLQFVLNCFADKPKQRGKKNISPEPAASVPSKLTFAWITGLLYRGFKKPLKEKDVFDLCPTDTCDALVPEFERTWEKEQYRVTKLNRHGSVTRTRSKSRSISGSSRKKPSETSPTMHVSFMLEKLAETGVNKEKSKLKSPSLVRVLFKIYGPRLVAVQIGKTIADLLTFLMPLLTEALIDYINNKNNQGPTLAVGYFFVTLLVSMIGNQFLLIYNRLGMHIKTMLMTAIYKKSLTIAESNEDTTTGEVVNLMSIDCQKVENFTYYLYETVSAPVQFAVCFYLLYRQLGLALFAGLGVLALGIPVNILVGIFLKKSSSESTERKEERMQIMNEILNGIKVLKLYAWEDSFAEKVEAVRKKELKQLKISQLSIAVAIFVYFCMLYLVQLTSFGVYTAISDDGYLSPTVAFVSLQLFNMLNVPLTFLPIYIPFMIQAVISVKRISKYLNREDIQTGVYRVDPDARNAIEIKNGEFTWDRDSGEPSLTNINMSVPTGSLVAVVGTVGSGKSSLLSAMLGEMHKMQGEVTLKSSVAYVPQEAWIQNATVKDNILFGREYNRQRYEITIDACALSSDLEILPGGDKTEIGEKGINISGGQKQRVSLARAVYSDRDILLLDDPLSAVDSHVGKHIFDKVIGHKGALQKKTRVLVTHGIHWLPMVDRIIVLKNGEISEVGTFDELLAKEGDFAEFLQEHFNEEQDKIDEESDVDPEVEEMKRTVFERMESVRSPTSKEWRTKTFPRFTVRQRATSIPFNRYYSKKESTAFRKGSTVRQRSASKTFNRSYSRKDSLALESHSGVFNHAQLQRYTSRQVSLKSIYAPVAGQTLIEEEISETGKVKLSTYLYFFRALGIKAISVSVLFYVFSAAGSVFTAIWLSKWTDDPYLKNQSNTADPDYRDKVNMYIGVYGAGTFVQGFFVFAFIGLWSLQVIKASKILHTNMLLNVLKAPMSFFDTTPIGRIVNRFSSDVEVIDFYLGDTMYQVIQALFSVLINIVIISYSTPIFLLVMVPIGFLYIAVQAIYLPASRQLRRIDSITRSPIYAHFSETLSDTASIRAYRSQERFTRECKDKIDHNFKFYYSGFVTNIWQITCMQFLCNIITFGAAIFAVTNDSISPGLVGLSISYSLQMTQAFQTLVCMMSQVETQAVSIERMREYTNIETEAPRIIPDNRPDTSWPDKGDMTFDHYQTRYRPGLDLVLKDITCQIKGGEKVGIVGRTGAGKSSMMVALFRIIEAAGGKIIIDGKEIASLGLHDLRSKLTILPQEPVLFDGSLRMNLDPFGHYSDSALWGALEHAYLKDFVSSLSQGLDYECGEGGSNLSVGQRQLVCLARTLLRKTKILILDEATAAVDVETERLIQNTIRSEFKDTTILTIAHRLNTIMDYDRVLVLDEGYKKEFDSPSKLLANPKSAFYGMAKDAGLV